MGMYIHILVLVLACIAYVLYQKYYVHMYTSIVNKPEKRYDYIIVGAGTAGCVLASRLTEDPNTKVLLIEAGGHMGYFTRIPLTSTAAQQSPYDWSVQTSPQKYSSFGTYSQTQFIPRGKGLGGSSQINFVLHGFGRPEDYERWSRLGFKGWSYNDLKPYFSRAFGTVVSEFDTVDCTGQAYCPGEKAPMKLKVIDEDKELMKVFREASKRYADKYTIFRKATATVQNGVRFQVLDAYLKPALNRPNLHVMLQTQGISVRFDNNTATSLYILKDHRDLDNIFVNKEIIISAGTIKSPQLLISSGIGQRELLRRLRIGPIAENDEVGANFHDHMNMPLYVSIQKPISITLAKVFSVKTAWEYLWEGRGLLAFPPMAAVEYQNSSALMLFSMGSTSERLLRDLSNYRTEVFKEIFPYPNDFSKEGFMFLATCIQPRSRGTVTLKDSSSTIPPVVDPNYLHDYWDVKCVLKALRRAERLIATKPFQDIGAKIHWPRSERCLSFWKYSKDDQTGKVVQKKKKKSKSKSSVKSAPKSTKAKQLKVASPPDEYVECVIRDVAVTGHHAGGTCAGGAVVDDELRVKHVRRLRVVDASVLPAPVSLYPNSVLIAMAEKAADLIKNTHYL
ncbi:neither inactivation nor afterpotential protein G [Epargyreus clarus]|uniref:neither inactivation nor afterpotential protein G n=1 Tax=Epargyreus clarus TaxID=520877 RepID=UPI003C2DB57E